ncbi:MAG: 23S rRNA (uracil(1939)-C(5))-methyltransferase RlmD [Candidatus Gastranaerophilales bacterium]|nr:23S rRNA (uracil(1939)-C(5))-methyltransferase RlmD [Candidatus Gastranaerophilales bacterium]
MNIDDEIIVNVEKLLYEGQGLARVDNFPIFIEDVCPQDKVKIKIVKLKKNYAQGQLVEIIEPSPQRVKPFCALHNVCGGCQWQFVSYDEQIKQKKNIVDETLKKFTGSDIEVKDVIKSPVTTEYRHKIQYPISQTKVSKRLLSGYYKKHTHELINIKHCPIQPVAIDELICEIKEKAQEFNISAYNERKHSGLLRHVVFKNSCSNGKNLIIFVINDEEISENIDKLATYIYKNCKNIAGILVNFNTKKNNVILGKESKLLIGEAFYEENLGDKTFQISANSFFQVNPKSAEKILETTKIMIQENTTEPTILDAYAGVSSFGIYLSDIAQTVVCVEEVEGASEDARTNKFKNNATNVEIVNGDASAEFKKMLDNNKQFDVVILDPPRKGCSEEALDFASKLSKKLIIYVSCNPATLARDLKYLHENGFKTKYVQPVDMFPHTYHIESVALIIKE